MKPYVVSHEGSPVLFEVWKWDSKLDLSGTCIPSDYEIESNFRGVVGVSLVELPFMVHCDFKKIMKEEVLNAL